MNVALRRPKPFASSFEACSALCAALEALGVRHVFGVPGTQNVALFEALRRSRIATVVPTHELAAAFMAGAYYRASGRPGVLATIGGPGLAYTIAGLAEARLDSAALVYIVNGRPSDAVPGYGLQALDQRALLAPVVKAVLSVGRREDAAEAIRSAYALSLSGEPGPVVVELCDDACAAQGAALTAPVGEPRRDVVSLLWQRIAEARRPVIVAGQGALASASLVATLAQRLQAPVLTTPSARGIIDEAHPLAMGFDVLRGTLEHVNGLLEASDLAIVLGAKLGHNGSAGFGLRLPQGKTIRVDSSREALAAVYPGRQSLCADVAGFLDHGSTLAIAAGVWTAAEIAGWRERISGVDGREAEPRIGGRSPQSFFADLGRGLPEAAMLVTDTGMHQVMARRHLQVRSPRGLLMPSDFQSMGFGLPAAIAAKLADPGRPVLALLGDGGLRITGFELSTAVKYRLSLPVIVLVDGSLNQIRLQQLSQFGASAGTDLGPLDLARLAEAVGIAHHRCDTIDGDVLDRALGAGRPTLIEVPVGDGLAIMAGAVRAGAVRHVRGLLPQSVKRRLASLRSARFRAGTK